MPRDPNLYPMTANQSLVRELDSLERRIAQLKGRTTTTIHQTAPGSIDDPLEGEVIIDPTDDKIKWYSGGEWRLCVCGVSLGNMNTVLMSGYATAETGYADIYVFDTEALTLTNITNQPDDGTESWEYYSMWNEDHSLIYAINSPAGVNPEELWSMNPDGSDANLIESFTGANYMDFTRTTDGTVYFVYRAQQSPNVHFAEIYNATTGTEVWSYDVRPVFGANAVPATMPWLNCDGTKAVLFIHPDYNNGLVWNAYTFNIPAGTYTGPVLTNVQANALGVIWSPTDPNKMMYRSTGTGVGSTAIHVMDADGSNKTQIYNNVTQLNERKWSPDGTKIAAKFQGRLRYMNADGTGVEDILVPHSGFEYEWSPDMTKFFTMGTMFGVTEMNLIDIATEVVTEVFNNNEEPPYFLAAPTWTDLQISIL